MFLFAFYLVIEHIWWTIETSNLEVLQRKVENLIILIFLWHLYWFLLLSLWKGTLSNRIACLPSCPDRPSSWLSTSNDLRNFVHLLNEKEHAACCTWLMSTGCNFCRTKFVQRIRALFMHLNFGILKIEIYQILIESFYRKRSAIMFKF